MTRLPPLTSLASMSPSNRWAILEAFAAYTLCEISGLLDGSISAPPGALKNARRRFKRIEAAAARFGDYIGEKPRIRVPAISRPLAA